MVIKQFEVWLADLNPRNGTESGKVRPVLVIQTNLLNRISHPSTIILPITSNVNKDSEILRVFLSKGQSGLAKDSDIMLDQIRSIDNRRLAKKLGQIGVQEIKKIKENLKIILDLEI
ncbi:type II toxin-antitoxin system PemK/MazF family toxin [Hyphobacterium sp. CCMP332]|nr:type II toxin-antitoxin system PemK/MazF family toxin [Hyphobacterium sp. CCMP332]